MPKLGKDADWEEKRAQLVGMERRHIIDSHYSYTNIAIWNKDDVEEYYDKNVTDEQVDKYYEALKLEEEKKARDEAWEKKYEETRPTEESFGMAEKIAKLKSLDLPEDEYQKRVDAYKEEFEFEQLKHDADHGKIIYSENKERWLRYHELSEKRDAKDLTETTASNEKDKTRLKDLQGEIARFKEPPVKPGWLAQLWNDFQKIFTGRDIKSVDAYNFYTSATAEISQLKEKIKETDAWIKEQFERNEERSKDATERAKRPEELAEYIVQENWKNSKTQNGMLSKNALSIGANQVMNSKEFKELIVDLKVNEMDIKPETFRKAYLKKLAQSQNKANQKTENEPENQKEKEQLQKSGDVKNLSHW